jgi:hypothetical protein
MNNENNLKLKDKSKGKINKSDSKELIKKTFEDKNKKEGEKEESEQQQQQQINSREQNPSYQSELTGESSNKTKQKEEEEKEQSNTILQEICANCKEKLDNDWKKPNWKWNMDREIKLCSKCYSLKEKEHDKLLNFCALCDSKLKFFRYNPKPAWKIKGQLCRKCWDSKNNQYKSKNLKTN